MTEAPMDNQQCDGYGVDPHPAHGLADILAPYPMRLCSRCWRVWLHTKETAKGHHRG